MPELTESSSKFFKRLQDAISSSKETNTRASLEVFSGTVAKVAKAAGKISKRVVDNLPQFTLHDEDHLWNVLRLMETLAGDATIKKMSPLECGIAILAAFTHDLGMALSAEELDTLTDPSAGEPDAHASPAAAAWRTYFDGHTLTERIREARTIAAAENRLLTAAEAAHLQRALGQIRSDFVRESHAREEGPARHNRIEDWLHRIEESLSLDLNYDGTDLSAHIALLAMSHGQSIFWLGERLTKRPKPLLEREDLVRAHRIKGLEVNWLFLSWLLRLADIMDFDASRTPAVLFDHIGIRDTTSVIEWQKHLSISEPPRFGQGTDRATLVYVCESCPHPRIEKAIHDMIGWINVELENVRAELQRHPPARNLNPLLPSRAVPDIQSRKDGYLYQDLEFQLRREAILELLMGESLYGNPGLALRELVQNALDAVHLRDLRNKLWRKLPDGKKPADMPQPHQPWENDETPKVSVTWGEEGGRSFIRVKDNGVGMTLGAIRRFLTQIGKSYYKSDTYRRERELMREHGLICTPISQFGIGFLSVFMLADKVTIRTRPAGSRDEFPGDRRTDAEKEAMRFPLRAEIDGPHGLIGVYPEQELAETGTEITLWLKREHPLVPWNREQTIRWLRSSLYDIFEETGNDDKEKYSDYGKDGRIHPAFEVARNIFWPLYPVALNPANEAATGLVLDSHFHPWELIPINSQNLCQKAEEWNFSAAGLDRVAWQCCDWEDNGPGGTGSRIRLILPARDGMSKPSTQPPDLAVFLNPPGKNMPGQMDIQTFVSKQHARPRSQQRLLINGVGGVEVDSVWDWQLIMANAGTIIWIDLRGPAAPKLTADRRQVTHRQSETAPQLAQAVQRRWYECLVSADQGKRSWLLTAAAGLQPPLRQRFPLRPVDELPVQKPFWRCRQLLIDGIWSRDCYQSFQGDWGYKCSRDKNFARALARARDRDLDLAHALDLDLARALDLARDLALALADGLPLAYVLSLDRDLFLHFRMPLAAAMICGVLSDAFMPSLPEALPGFPPSGWEGSLCACGMSGPLRLTAPSSAHIEVAWLADYHLCAPLTGVPLGPLRFGREAWAKDRKVLSFPFFLGDALANELRPRAAKWQRELCADPLMLFLPGSCLWHHRFADLPQEEWAAHSASALWDIAAGTVRYADGIHTRDSLRANGLPMEEWFQKSKLPPWDPEAFIREPHHTQDF